MILLLSLVALLLSSGAQAAQFGAFADLGQHAKTEALGGVTVTADSFGVGSNPAAVFFTTRGLVTTGGALEAGEYSLLSLKGQQMAVAHSELDLGDFGLPYSEKITELAYARSAAPWVWGMGLKLYNAGGDFTEEGTIGAHGYGVDLGLLRPLGENFVFGFLLRDAFSRITWQDHPWYGDQNETKYAMARELSFGVKCELNSTRASVDIVDLGKSNLLRAGLEQSLSEWLDLRVGFDGSNPTAGLGVGIGPWQFDYCYGYYQGTQRLSAQWNF